jgi:hypothetical protein
VPPVSPFGADAHPAAQTKLAIAMEMNCCRDPTSISSCVAAIQGR